VIVSVRLSGVIEAVQSEGAETFRNDRLVGVASTSLIFARIDGFDELPDDFVTSLTDFWTQYERLRGVGFKVVGVEDAAAAVEAVRQSSKRDA
jgi:inorganic pyrophosphatase